MQNHHLLSLFCVVQIHWAQSHPGTSGDCFIARWWNPRKEEIRNQKGKPEWLCGAVTVHGRSRVRQLFLFGKLICFSCKVDSYHLHKASPRAISCVPLLPALQPSFGAGREGVKCCSLAEEGPQLHARSAWGARAGTAVPSEGIPSHVKLICSSKRAWLNWVCVEVGVCAGLG